ncbi:MAG: hypothetical protein B6242_13530 [Anaerolineaceae bacterium 4572_78]|nr:MAG: hypothetical protein B6242_13530 [Anaerolineaceae bacterium 4572_78]
MTTLLEQGISAAKNGNKKESKRLLHQVLQADSHSERAWLWLSQVANTTGERMSYLEKVLDINPNNVAAQIAWKKLEKDAMIAMEPTPLRPNLKPPELVIPSFQKPFEIGENFKPLPITVTKETSSKSVVPEKPMAPSSTAEKKHDSSQKKSSSKLRKKKLVSAASRKTKLNPVVKPKKKHKRKVVKKRPSSEEPIPLIPAVMFGTLSMTATGGIFMIIYLMMSGW